jgi:hypothetical protein
VVTGSDTNKPILENLATIRMPPSINLSSRSLASSQPSTLAFCELLVVLARERGRDLRELTSIFRNTGQRITQEPHDLREREG